MDEGLQGGEHPLPEDGPALHDAERGTTQDWRRLQDYLSTQGLALSLQPTPRQFAGGLANLNYRVVVDGREAVLRRPPAGPLPAGGFDMGREFRILSRLWRGLPLAPRGLHYCPSAEVLGAPFQLIEFRRGTAVRAELSPALAAQPQIGARLGGLLVDTLARIHAVDPAAVELDTLGRPEGFLLRAVEGWALRAGEATQDSATRAIRVLIRETAGWLRRHRVPDGAPVLLHNDLKLDNILLDPSTLQPLAVLDWDQCTRGDARFDLATTLSYWTEPGDPPELRALRQMPSDQPGFASRQALAEDYARRSGCDLSDFRFFRVLALFKLAVIFWQLHRRYRDGVTADPRYAAFGRIADAVIEFSRVVARGHVF